MNEGKAEQNLTPGLNYQGTDLNDTSNLQSTPKPNILQIQDNQHVTPNHRSFRKVIGEILDHGTCGRKNAPTLIFCLRIFEMWSIHSDI